MTDNEIALLGTVYLVAKQIEREKRERGTRRIGGDWYRDAIRLLQSERPKILRALRELQE